MTTSTENPCWIHYQRQTGSISSRWFCSIMPEVVRQLLHAGLATYQKMQTFIA